MTTSLKATGICLLLAIDALVAPAGNLSIATMPPGEAPSADYALSVNGRTVPVYVCRVSAVPFNQIWPGYQRPLEQTELAAFASWDSADAVTVKVTSQRAFKSAVVRPLAHGIVPVVSGPRITFKIPRPGQYTLELDGQHHALHLFANPPERGIPATNAPNVRYFGPGVHHPGEIKLSSNQTVYIAGGAVVHGFIRGLKVSNVRILGRGIIDVSGFERAKAAGAINLNECTDVTIEGVIIRDTDVWSCSLFGCRRAEISNIKFVGLWRYNTDGIDICNSQDITIRDSFVRAFDDCIALKGLCNPLGPTDKEENYDKAVRNIIVERCVLWCDWGRALEIGLETRALEIAHVVFADCDILRANMVAMDIQHGDRATVSDILYRDIRVEIDEFNQPPRFQKSAGETYSYPPNENYCPQLMVIDMQGNSGDQQHGRVQQVIYRNITVTGGNQFPASSFKGRDDAHNVSDITIENLVINGQRITTPTDARLQQGPYVQNVSFKSSNLREGQK